MAKPRKQKKSVNALLYEPILETPLMALGLQKYMNVRNGIADDPFENERSRIKIMKLLKIRAFAQEFDIDTKSEDWMFETLLELALKYVPALQTTDKRPSKRGVKQIYDGLSDKEIEIRNKINENGCTLIEACREYIKENDKLIKERNIILNEDNFENNAQTLASRYREGQKYLRDLRKKHLVEERTDFSQLLSLSGLEADLQNAILKTDGK